MKRTKLGKIAAGTGLLGIALLTAATSATAAPRHGVKEARKDVKTARKEVRREVKDLHRADTPAERRDARRDVRDAQRDLRREQRDIQRERLERERRERDQRDRNSWRNRNAWDRNKKRNNWPKHNNGNSRRINRTLEGVVTRDTSGNSFTLRTSTGQNVQVQVQGGEPRRISRGDYVRVYGFSSGIIFHAQNLTILRNR